MIGNKNNPFLWKHLLGKLIPSDIKKYVEPFGGEFGLYQRLYPKPEISIYNDINTYLYNKIKDRYKDVIYHNKDYKEIIEMYDSNDTFFYVDSPYYGLEHYYKNHNFLKEENHVELCETLKNIKGRFLVSYQSKTFILELYKDYNIYNYNGKTMFHKNEIAITNYVQ